MKAEKSGGIKTKNPGQTGVFRMDNYSLSLCKPQQNFIISLRAMSFQGLHPKNTM
jgi:hypothetical protein